MAKLNLEYTYLITGGAGFIGFHLAKRLLKEGARIVLADNMNPYYDLKLKEERLALLKKEGFSEELRQVDIADREALFALFAESRPQVVVNLAAQAGVRYSIDHPEEYIHANIVGFFNILEACRKYPVKHLLFASSSSIYGMNRKVPFSTEDRTDEPVSLYAATKKSDELMGHAYAKLFRIPMTGVRFFTVYGPLGRPDMAYFKFADRIMDDLMPPIIRQFMPQIRTTTVLVTGESKNSIELGSMDVSKAPEAYYYQPITPREIAVLRDCDFLTFTADDEETKRAFTEACAENGIVFADMSDMFLEEYESEHMLPHGFMNTSPGTGHLNRTGHRLIAARLAEIIGTGK